MDVHQPINKTTEGNIMITIAIVLAVLWVLGMITSVTAGGLLHLLLVAAIIMVVVNLISGRNAV